MKNNKISNWLRYQEVFKKWTQEEKDKVLFVMKKLPQKLIKNIDFDIHRAKKSMRGNNAASSAPAIKKIVLYDQAFLPKQNLYNLIVHELGHFLYNNLGNKEKGQYWKVASWMEVQHSSNNTQIIPLRDKFVEPDGRFSPAEDFSNNIESFFSREKRIKNLNPKIYKWIEFYFKRR